MSKYTDTAATAAGATAAAALLVGLFVVGAVAVLSPVIAPVNVYRGFSWFTEQHGKSFVWYVYDPNKNVVAIGVADNRRSADLAGQSATATAADAAGAA
jgi:hypothetical protein